VGSNYLDKLKNDAKKFGFTYEKLGKYLGVSKGQISHYFSLKNHISFDKFVELLKLIYDDTNVISNYIAEYALNIDDLGDVRAATEFLDSHGREDLIKQIIKKYADEPYLKVYKVIAERNEGILSEKQVYWELEKLKSITPEENNETNLLINVKSLSCCINLQAVGMVHILAEDLLELIKSIPNQYIKESLELKILDTVARAHQKQSELEIAIDICNDVIKRSENYPLEKIYMLNLLSEIHVFSSYEKSINYNKKALDLYNKLGSGTNLRFKDLLESTHDFIKIFHEDYEDLFLTDPAEKAYYLVSNGNPEDLKKGISLLEQMKSKNGKLSPQQEYYYALSQNDLTLMEESLLTFEKAGDIFYSNLPKNHLIGKKNHL